MNSIGAGKQDRTAGLLAGRNALLSVVGLADPASSQMRLRGAFICR